jgi:hypothetical protein
MNHNHRDRKVKNKTKNRKDSSLWEAFWQMDSVRMRNQKDLSANAILLITGFPFWEVINL